MAEEPAPTQEAPAAKGPPPPPTNVLPEGGGEARPPALTAPPEAPDYYGQLLRLKAEFENYRKRTDRERPEIMQWGRAEVLLSLLPIYDLLLKAHEDIQAAHTDMPLAKGMEGIFKEFERLFKDEGVEAMSPLGKPFDAMLHEVLAAVDREGCEPGAVAEVVQRGFTLRGKVLRPAKVIIAKKKE